METIRQRAVLTAVLLDTLARHKDGLRIHDVYETIDSAFTFPESWYRELPESPGYEELQKLGYPDWRTISQERLVELVRTEPQWKNEIRWARNELRKLGYLDMSAPRGSWRLSTLGKRAAADHAETSLTPAEKRIATPRVARPSRRPRQANLARLAEPGANIREELLSKLNLLARGVPLADLELLVDLARVVRRRTLLEDETESE